MKYLIHQLNQAILSAQDVWTSLQVKRILPENSPSSTLMPIN